MSWEAFLLLINLRATEWCTKHYPKNKDCVENVVDCVLDGESLKFCKGVYKDEHKSI
jgi:hypothetical protein